MNIYEIPSRYQEMLSLLEDSPDESLQEAVDNAIAEIKSDLGTHAENLGKALSNLKSQEEGAKIELARIKALIDSRTKRYDAIKNGIRRAMIDTNTPRIDTNLYTFTLAKGRASVEIVDQSKLADEYVDVEVITKPVKAKIKIGIEEGKIDQSIAKMLTGEKSLRIK